MGRNKQYVDGLQVLKAQTCPLCNKKVGVPGCTIHKRVNYSKLPKNKRLWKYDLEGNKVIYSGIYRRYICRNCEKNKEGKDTSFHDTVVGYVGRKQKPIVTKNILRLLEKSLAAVENGDYEKSHHLLLKISKKDITKSMFSDIISETLNKMIESMKPGKGIKGEMMKTYRESHRFASGILLFLLLFHIWYPFDKKIFRMMLDIVLRHQNLFSTFADWIKDIHDKTDLPISLDDAKSIWEEFEIEILMRIDPNEKALELVNKLLESRPKNKRLMARKMEILFYQGKMEEMGLIAGEQKNSDIYGWYFFHVIYKIHLAKKEIILKRGQKKELDEKGTYVLIFKDTQNYESYKEYLRNHYNEIFNLLLKSIYRGEKVFDSIKNICIIANRIYIYKEVESVLKRILRDLDRSILRKMPEIEFFKLTKEIAASMPLDISELKEKEKKILQGNLNFLSNWTNFATSSKNIDTKLVKIYLHGETNGLILIHLVQSQLQQYVVQLKIDRDMHVKSTRKLSRIEKNLWKTYSHWNPKLSNKIRIIAFYSHYIFGQYDKCIETYRKGRLNRKVPTEDPNWKHFIVSHCHLATGNYPQALKALRRINKFDPNLKKFLEICIHIRREDLDTVVPLMRNLMRKSIEDNNTFLINKLSELRVLKYYHSIIYKPFFKENNMKKLLEDFPPYSVAAQRQAMGESPVFLGLFGIFYIECYDRLLDNLIWQGISLNNKRLIFGFVHKLHSFYPSELIEKYNKLIPKIKEKDVKINISIAVCMQLGLSLSRPKESIKYLRETILIDKKSKIPHLAWIEIKKYCKEKKYTQEVWYKEFNKWYESKFKIKSNQSS